MKQNKTKQIESNSSGFDVEIHPKVSNKDEQQRWQMTSKRKKKRKRERERERENKIKFKMIQNHVARTTTNFKRVITGKRYIQSNFVIQQLKSYYFISK